MGIFSLTAFQSFYLFGFLVLALLLAMKLKLSSLFLVVMCLIGALWLIHIVALIVAWL